MKEYHDNKYGVYSIKTGLSISWDYDTSPSDKSQRSAVFLFTPNPNNTDDHHHIEMDREQAQKLRDWLDAFIKDV